MTPIQRPLAFIYDRHATPTRGILLLRLGACGEYAEERGWEVGGEWVDEGDDALSDDRRPRFDQTLAAMLDAHRSGRTVVCLVCDWDRLSRSRGRRLKLARQVRSAGGWIETIAGETTKPEDQRRGVLSGAPNVTELTW